MTAERRLAKLEAALSPTELVLRWLDEAHAFGDLETYVRAQLAETPLDPPLDRLAREAVACAQAGAKGKGKDVVAAAIRAALRDTVFRFELVMRIIVTSHELLEREELIDAALSAHVALLTSMDEKLRGSDPWYQGRFGSLRNALVVRVDELQATQAARETVEARYLAGHPALFPDALAAWAEQVRATETLAAFAGRLAELDGFPLAEPGDPDAHPTRTTELVTDLVEPAKATALEKLGEGDRSLRIAAGWVRAKLARDADIGGSSAR